MTQAVHGGSQGEKRRDLIVLVVTSLVALALGVLTAYAQGWLPDELGPLANSSGTWALVAFALALLASSGSMAALTGTLALLALLAGYILGADVRGSSSSSSLVVFWGLAAVTAGPALGLSAHWVRTRNAALAPLGAGAVAGALIGEGVYGLMFIADTTYPPYWATEIGVGVALLCGIAAMRLRTARPIGLAVATTAAVTAAFVAVYSQDLITLL